MEITFKYRDKIITTPNLEKKLKRMKLTLEDIEIIETPIKKKPIEDTIESYMLNKECVIVRSTKDNIRRICYVNKDCRPTIKELFKNQIYNPETKTGLYTKEFIETMYYEDGKLYSNN